MIVKVAVLITVLAVIWIAMVFYHTYLIVELKHRIGSLKERVTELERMVKYGTGDDSRTHCCNSDDSNDGDSGCTGE